jgi:hypothetical protein
MAAQDPRVVRLALNGMSMSDQKNIHHASYVRTTVRASGGVPPPGNTVPPVFRRGPPRTRSTGPGQTGK